MGRDGMERKNVRLRTASDLNRKGRARKKGKKDRKERKGRKEAQAGRTERSRREETGWCRTRNVSVEFQGDKNFHQ